VSASTRPLVNPVTNHRCHAAHQSSSIIAKEIDQSCLSYPNAAPARNSEIRSQQEHVMGLRGAATVVSDAAAPKILPMHHHQQTSRVPSLLVMLRQRSDEACTQQKPRMVNWHWKASGHTHQIASQSAGQEASRVVVELVR
jgi:hypothetical protein